MIRISRAFEQCAEFLERQMCFDFGRVARAVIPIIVRLRDSMRAWEKPARPSPNKALRRAQLSLWPLNPFPPYNQPKGA